MKRHVLKFFVLAMALAFGFAYANSQPVVAQEFEPNIMDIAAADDRFDTLEAAVKAAGLADTLASADNTFTVFAPTDDAFAALPPALIDALLADPEGALTDILLYHVVPGEMPSGMVLASETLATVQGQSLTVSLRDGAPFVDDSQIIITDIEAKNGIIHVIDAVLVPDITLPDISEPAEEMEEAADAEPMEEAAPAPADEPTEEAAPADTSNLPTIAEIAVSNGSFDTLVAALTAADLVDVFTQPGNYTVFAPTDDAFAAIPAERLEELLADPSGELTNILLFHVVGDKLTRDQLATDTLVPTLDGRPLTVNRDGSNIENISGAEVITYDIEASNGIIHVIDAVLIP